MNKPILYIFSGLPGSGKSALAQGLARASGAVYLRIDTVEQAIRELCDFNVEGEGYRLAYRVAADNLKLGTCVIADSCNPIELTRKEWNEVAIHSGVNFINIEVICTDRQEHKYRVETRNSAIKGLVLPTWEQVENREYHAWRDDRLVIDTAGKSVDESVSELLAMLGIQKERASG